MPRGAWATKGALAKRRRDLALYEQVLPSLELKRQRLLAECFQAQRARDSARATLAALRRDAGERYAMLANEDIALAGLARVAAIDTAQARVIGTPVPQLLGVHWAAPAQYGYLAKPHWVDGVLESVRALARQRLEVAFAEERLRILEAAVRKALQRVNLFQKVLIPAARADIRRIRVVLADGERAAVVRSKIFKARHARSSVGELAP